MTAISSFRGYYRFLSNFWSQPLWFDGVEYRSGEFAYQSQKPLHISDRLEVRACATPGEAKRLANTCVRVPYWHANKLAVMLEVQRSKYAEQTARSLLLSTGSRKLVEGNTHGDTFWGVVNGVGQNHLGRIIMLVRDEINH